MAAARKGDLAALIAALDPAVEYRPDAVAMRLGATRLVGAEAVAAEFFSRGRGARPALLDGVPGAVWAPRGEPLIVFIFRARGEKITTIEVIGQSKRITRLAPVFAIDDPALGSGRGDTAASSRGGLESAVIDRVRRGSMGQGRYRGV